jgi:hypothetical protein
MERVWYQQYEMDLKFLRSTEAKLKRNRIKNETFGEETGIQNLIVRREMFTMAGE